MPSYEYSVELGVFVKECCDCRKVFVGTANEEESFKIFVEAFLKDNRGQGDGLRSICRGCNVHRRIRLRTDRKIIEDMWHKQNGCCAICEKEISITPGASFDDRANLDHDENTGYIRELLCRDCNVGIGIFKHNIGILRKAISYLLKHSAVVPFKRRA